MNTQPVVGYPSMSRHNLVDYMRARRRDMLPVVDAAGRLVGVEFLVDTIQAEMQPNEVVVMAGGFGRRLGALTRDCPKPLLNVGSRPILKTIIESFAEQGFRRFWIAVNYLAPRIEVYFGDGRHWGVEIEYLREEMPLGTADALSLLPRPPTHPLIVMNGVILTKVRFDELIAFHREALARATMCIRRHEVTIPYGVVEAADGYLSGMIEKPRQNCFINAGIYVLEPELIAALAPGQPRDMPDIVEAAMARERAVALYPIREYWMDIGQIKDFKAVSHARGRSPFGVGTAMAPRRIGIVTGGRTDWSLLLPVLRAVLSAPDLELRLSQWRPPLAPSWRHAARHPGPGLRDRGRGALPRRGRRSAVALP